MYSSTHADAAQTAAKYGIEQQLGSSTPPATDKAQTTVQQAAVEVADIAVHGEVPAGPSVALSESKPGSNADSAETGAAPVAQKLTGLSL